MALLALGVLGDATQMICCRVYVASLAEMKLTAVILFITLSSVANDMTNLRLLYNKWPSYKKDFLKCDGSQSGHKCICL